MSPTNPFMASQLRQLIYYHLDNDLLQNALFLAGRLHGLEPRGPDAAHLLALCHLRLGQLKAAYDHSKEKGVRGAHLGCAYVFAQACLGLERYNDGISALDRARGLWGGRNNWNKHSENSRRHVPDAAAVNCLLGKLWRANGDIKKAAECYAEALKQNPFMWDAFLDLCDTGVALRTSNIFKLTPEMLAFLSATSSLGVMEEEATQNFPLQPHSSNGIHTLSTPGNDPFNSTVRTAGDPGLNHGGSNLYFRLNGLMSASNGGNSHPSDWETPTTNGGSFDTDTMMKDAGSLNLDYAADSEPPLAPPRKTRTLQSFVSEATLEAPKMKSITTRNRIKGGSETSEADSTRGLALPGAHKRTISGHVAQANTSAHSDPSAAPQRRSVRLFNQIRPSSSRLASSVARDVDSKEKRELKKAKAPSTKGRPTSTVGRVVSGNRNHSEATDRGSKDIRYPSITNTTTAGRRPPPQPQLEPAQEREALQWLLELLGKLGSGYYHLSRYQCELALQAFNSVPAQHRETPWVLAQIGKAYFEKSAYVEAEDVFTRITKMAPSRMEDMEVYSTVLWHRKADLDLAYLSHVLVEADRLAPQSWCAIGNSFALQREHDQAIKCFKRATQLDPKFAYAYTLQGHEHYENEEWDKALYAYRCAISADSRHYNGWYGLGRTYEKMGKYEVAEKHYRAAARINPTNAILIVCIGVVLEKLDKTQAALAQYTEACEVDPKSTLTRFRKARTLMNLRYPREALAELEMLKDMAPDEAQVHYFLGRAYKMLHDKTSAIRHYTIALNLDPKASQVIKEAMESLDDDDDDDYDDDDAVE